MSCFSEIFFLVLVASCLSCFLLVVVVLNFPFSLFLLLNCVIVSMILCLYVSSTVP